MYHILTNWSPERLGRTKKGVTKTSYKNIKNKAEIVKDMLRKKKHNYFHDIALLIEYISIMMTLLRKNDF